MAELVAEPVGGEELGSVGHRIEEDGVDAGHQDVGHEGHVSGADLQGAERRTEELRVALAPVTVDCIPSVSWGLPNQASKQAWTHPQSIEGGVEDTADRAFHIAATDLVHLFDHQRPPTTDAIRTDLSACGITGPRKATAFAKLAFDNHSALGVAGTLAGLSFIHHIAIAAYTVGAGAGSCLIAGGIEPITNRPLPFLGDGAIGGAVAKCGGRLITIEDHQVICGMGAQISHALSQNGVAHRVKSLGIPGEFGQSAYMAAQLYDQYGLNAAKLVEAAEALMK